MLARILSFILSALLLWSLPITASAQVSDSMQEYFAGSKSYSNSTPAGRYQGQTMGVYTMGNYVKRAPQVTTNLASIQLPSIKAGCGGIDAFSGGFSFIDGDALGDLLSAILQDAEGFAFMIAIDVVDAQIGSGISKLQSWIQEINSRSINSCDAAAAAVGSLAAQIPIAAEHACKRLGSSKGMFSDFAAARNGCQDRSKEVLDGTDDEEKKQIAINRNYGFEATAENSLYSSDIEMREFLMSISGSIIIRQEAADAEFHYDYIEPIALDEAAVQKLMEGGELKVHKCDDAACLEVTPLGKSVSIAETDAFKLKVEAILSSMYDKLSGEDETAFTTEEIQFVEQTTLPVYKAIDVYQQALPNRGKMMILSYSDLIAYEMVLKFLEDQTNEVLEGAQKIVGGERESFQMWREGVEENRRLLLEQRTLIDQRFETTTAFITEVSRLEAQNAARLINVLSASRQTESGRN